MAGIFCACAMHGGPPGLIVLFRRVSGGDLAAVRAVLSGVKVTPTAEREQGDAQQRPRAGLEHRRGETGHRGRLVEPAAGLLLCRRDAVVVATQAARFEIGRDPSEVPAHPPQVAAIT